MLTHLLRLILAHSPRPFVFRPREFDQLRFRPGPLGLYVHVPFCRTLCDFCPYFKLPYSSDDMDRYLDAVTGEIAWAKARMDRPAQVTSTYFGGGTPALAEDGLVRIMDSLRGAFGDLGHAGIELHPEDLKPGSAARLREIGFDMASIGIQSFEPRSLGSIGREPAEIDAGFRELGDAGFRVLDVDLIFGLPNQSVDQLAKDFRRATELGATQISTYPFISFSYAGRRYPRVSRSHQRESLERLIRTAHDLGWNRTSIWTFAAPGTDKYSSVTRENFLGFGPSAASLLEESFKVNTFDLDEYVRVWGEQPQGTAPALSMPFTPRTRALYWLFWAWYGLHLDGSEFRELFGQPLEKVFGRELFAARFVGLVDSVGEDFVPTPRGAYFFHHVEQIYTHQYIDKTWRMCGSSPWPEAIRLW